MNLVWLRTWQLGVKSLLLHPLRSLLTVLGIFIGVASVIWLLAIGEGISIKAQEQIAGLGANNVIVRSKKPPSDVVESTRGNLRYGITREDYARILATIPTIESAIPIRELRRKFTYADDMVDGRLVGCTPEFAAVTRLQMQSGRFLTDVDNQQRQTHCVLAASVADHLFPLESPLGKSIHVDELYYVVVGVVKPKTATAAIGGSLAAQDFSSDVYVPISTLQSRIGDVVITRRSGSFEREEVQLSQVTLRVDKTEHVLETAELIKQTLEPHHRNQDFAIVVPLELLEQAKTTRLMFIIFMGLIAAVSLLVGGIGIMNIMLATVTERTREIGIRRALGAKRRDIVRQFLVETVALSTVGGVTGILGGLTCKPVLAWMQQLLQWLFPKVVGQMPEVIRTVEPQIVPVSIPLAFVIAVTIGIVFGLYPARRAARMDPIEALRHE
jgi:putative ABC transport system permease protein